MTQQNKSDSAEKAIRESTIIEFYNRCCKSADKSPNWDNLDLRTQIQFTQCVAYIHSVIYNGQ